MAFSVLAQVNENPVRKHRMTYSVSLLFAYLAWSGALCLSSHQGPVDFSCLSRHFDFLSFQSADCDPKSVSLKYCLIHFGHPCFSSAFLI